MKKPRAHHGSPIIGKAVLAALLAASTGSISAAAADEARGGERPGAIPPPRHQAIAGHPLVLAVVVGSNASPGPGLDPLRYADDDAIQNARTITLLGGDVQLLVTPDAETHELFPRVRPSGGATRAAISAAFARVAASVKAARARGRTSRLYVLFAGHGDEAGGRAFLQLDDGRLWREDLAEALTAAGADENHVVVDACRAWQFVGTRGPGGERAALAPGFSRHAGPDWPARTGFLTARSAGGQTHEWTEFQGGIFSHEVRSGLLGAADLDGDGRVTYRELGAFVAQANAAIANRKYRPAVVTSPPGNDLDATMATLPTGPLVLDLDLPRGGRTFVESESGVRLADLNVPAGARVSLRLPIDLGTLYVQRESPTAEYRIPADPGRVALSTVESTMPRARARGAAHEAFRRLFALPFDATALAGWRPDRSDDRDQPAGPARSRMAAWVVMGMGAGAALAGGGFALSAGSLADEAQRSSGLRRSELAPEIDRRNQTAAVLGVIGAAAVIGGAAWWAWINAADRW